jgi:hypothetical protein
MREYSEGLKEYIEEVKLNNYIKRKRIKSWRKIKGELK